MKLRGRLKSPRPPSSSVGPPELRPVGPPPAARVLALAHHVEESIEAGTLADYAAAARLLGVTRARLTQIMNLRLLAPEIQERLLSGELRATERSLRATARESDWQEQLVLHRDQDGGTPHD